MQQKKQVYFLRMSQHLPPFYSLPSFTGTGIEIYKIQIYRVVKDNAFVYIPNTSTNNSGKKISYFKKGRSFCVTSLVTFLSTPLQETTLSFWGLEHVPNSASGQIRCKCLAQHNLLYF